MTNTNQLCLIKNKDLMGVFFFFFPLLAGEELAVQMRCSVGPQSATICSEFDSSKHCLV